ncbi:bifunctional ADP-dependent NAD(P)H-hydrate dehydratase/NAD(P)H-hydrate epimerase [Desulfovibrio inopinatus]|uniref:bifunctional ADP-dependent NAD(P)H-hydrate dehydratase/NAD(P)H-hydrate epimerase n=1 Tax=Desulfovibrio inopinatus TaxID=102109 RepID=UPI00042285C4|nr:bifunctional ADP-dependent NAD(P)H-hydrate dehydratase/NAD(P)H-hydrate epimerase [Desulfovibrio inopinatus]
MKCTPLPTPAEMALWDKTSIEEIGIHGHVLMENASREAVAVLRQQAGDLTGKRVAFLAGPGNNGGDALAMARIALDDGIDPIIYLTKPQNRYKGSAGYNLKLTKKLGIPIATLRPDQLTRFPRPDILVDGLLGTGFSGELREDFVDIVNAVNTIGQSAFVFAVDIPSGVNGLTGHARPTAVYADVTVTFEAAKFGLVQPQAQPYVGRLIVRSIGIPRQVKAAHPATHVGLGPELGELLDTKDPFIHKGSAGRLLVIGGSRGLTGAPLLCGLAAMRAGSGLVTVACPGGVETALKAGCPDIMTMPTGQTDGWSADLVSLLFDKMRETDSLVVGPGMGRTQEAGLFLQELINHITIPTVYDADALFHLAEAPNFLKSLPHTAVLTPHPGEMARLLGMSIPEVEADRPAAVRRLSEKTDATLVLKGPGTLIMSGKTPETAPAPIHYAPIFAPCLAVGGSGDILAGMIGALAAKGFSLLPATCLAVYWHGLCGLALEKDYPYRGNLPTEIIDIMPHALKEWLHA